MNDRQRNINKVCPVPEESAVMNEIKTELDEQGFIINISIRVVFSISLSEYLS